MTAFTSMRAPANARTRTVFLSDAEVEVRYDFQAADPGHFDNITGTNNCPPNDAAVTINELLINGEWIDTKHFSTAWIKKAENDLLTDICDDLRERDLL